MIFNIKFYQAIPLKAYKWDSIDSSEGSSEDDGTGMSDKKSNYKNGYGLGKFSFSISVPLN